MAIVTCVWFFQLNYQNRQIREFSYPLDTLEFYGKRSRNCNALTFMCALGLIKRRLALTEHALINRQCISQQHISMVRYS